MLLMFYMLKEKVGIINASLSTAWSALGYNIIVNKVKYLIQHL